MSAPGNKTTVLFVNHTACMGGAERSLVELIAALDHDRYAITTVLPERGDLAAALEVAGASVRLAPVALIRRPAGPGDLFSTLRRVSAAIPQLRECIESTGASIVHANSTTAQIYAGPAAARAGAASVWHCRDLVDLGLARRWLVRGRPRVVCISNAVRENLPDSIRRACSVEVILNGIAMQRIEQRGRRDQTRQDLGLDADARVVTMVAPFVPWKEHHRFLEMAAAVQSTSPSTQFLVVGDDRPGHHPEYGPGLREAASRLGLEKSVLFTGHRDDVPAILEASDVLVHPPHREPFGRVVVEAMAMALPVVAVDDAGPSEIIRHEVDGLLTSGSPAELAAAVIRLLTDAALAERLGNSARTRARADFDISRTAREIQELYETPVQAMP